MKGLASRFFIILISLELNACFQASKFSNGKTSNALSSGNANERITVPSLEDDSIDLPENTTSGGGSKPEDVTSNPAPSGTMSIVDRPDPTCAQDITSMQSDSSDQGVVKYAYCLVLKRLVDESGLTSALEMLRKLKITSEEIVYWLLVSDEFKNSNEISKLSNSDYVTLLYRRLLLRDPDQAGLQWHVDTLTRGSSSRDQKAYEFVLSSEFASRHSFLKHKLKHLCEANTVEAPIYIVAGQSNALGYAKISDTAGQWFWDYWSRIESPSFSFWGIGNGNRNDSSWQGGYQIQTTGHGHSFGPELTLLAHLQRSGTKNFYLFKAAWGGSSLLGSQPNGNNWLSRGAGAYYDVMVQNLRKAAIDICNSGSRPVVKGFFWMQGESDWPFPEAYKIGLTRLVTELSQDILTPTTPIVIGKVKRNEAHDWEPIRAVQDSMNGYLPTVSTIETTDLETNSDDKVHYNAHGQIEMGRRVFMKFIDAETNKVFLDILERPIPADYATYLSARFAEGSLTLAQFRQSVAQSPEAQGKISNAYLALFGHAIALDSLASTTSKLAEGTLTFAQFQQSLVLK